MIPDVNTGPLSDIADHLKIILIIKLASELLPKQKIGRVLHSNFSSWFLCWVITNVGDWDCDNTMEEDKFNPVHIQDIVSGVRHCLAYSIIFKETEKRYVPF